MTERSYTSWWRGITRWTKGQAEAAGEKRYLGSPCKKCLEAGEMRMERYVKCRGCMSCKIARIQKPEVVKQRRDYHHRPDVKLRRKERAITKRKRTYNSWWIGITRWNRAQARASGEKHYLGTPCGVCFKSGRVVLERYCRGGGCVSCTKSRALTPEAKAVSRLYGKKYRANPANKLKMRLYARDYNSRPEVKDRRKAIWANRVKTDPIYLLTKQVRACMSSAFSRLEMGKLSSTNKLIGLPWDKLYAYLLTTMPYGLTWAMCHIDHIIALANMDLSTLAGQKVAFSWKNLQLIEASANLDKNDKLVLDPEEIHHYRTRHLPEDLRDLPSERAKLDIVMKHVPATSKWLVETSAQSCAA